MSDIRTPQEPGEELKRLVAEIVDGAARAGAIPYQDMKSNELSSIKIDASQKIENYIQSRIPEVSEEAREFAEDLGDEARAGMRFSDHPHDRGQKDDDELKAWIAELIAARDKAREEKWRETLKALLNRSEEWDACGESDPNFDSISFDFWSAQKEARALLSEKS